ncbi:unannotated protein [freshwater metagenome]|uniref:Unannotated protein n=1 Tax=freshwater metagenome TaxID=449393 RepID=A0A6J7M6X7_9ZZZZ
MVSVARLLAFRCPANRDLLGKARGITQLIVLMLMDMSRSIALALVRQDLSGINDQVASTHERVVATRHGESAAVLVSVDDREALEETLEILADSALVTSIQRSLKSKKRHSIDEVRSRLSRQSPG